MHSRLFLKSGHKFSDEDKESCADTVRRVLELANTARKYGILALETLIDKEGNFLLKTGLSLVTDGTEPETLKSILENFIVSSNYTGFELLRALIALEGVCDIQQGQNPGIIAMRLVSMLGEKYVSYFEKELIEPTGATLELYEHLANKFIDQKALKESAEFETRLSSLDFSSVQLVLRQVEHDRLSCAMMGCKFSTIKLITDNLSIRTAVMVLEEMELIRPIKPHILEAQTKILELVNTLVESGEIFMPNIKRNAAFVVFENEADGKPDLQ